MSQKLLFDLNSNSSNISLQIRDAHQSLFVVFYLIFLHLYETKVSPNWHSVPLYEFIWIQKIKQ